MNPYNVILDKVHLWFLSVCVVTFVGTKKAINKVILLGHCLHFSLPTTYGLGKKAFNLTVWAIRNRILFIQKGI